MRAFLGIGGNLGDRLATLRSGVSALARDVPHTRVLGGSPVYETRPLGPSEEPFLNAVVEIRTSLSPTELLERLLDIEIRHGRQRHGKWEARTLDLDVLLLQRARSTDWVDVTVSNERLSVPHPRMTERDFVLVPLADLVGAEAMIRGRSLHEWLERLDDGARTILRRLDEGLRA